MKKIISFLLVAVLAVGVMLSMVSCGGDIEEGTYKSGDGTTIVVDGSKFEMSVGEVTTEFKYEIDDEAKTLTFKFHKSNSEQATAYYEGLDEKMQSTTVPFEVIEGGFKLDGKEYKKQ